MSPTARTLAYLRTLGYLAATVERWNPHAKVRQDLLGIGDVLAVAGEIVLIQATTQAHVAARVAKVTAHPNLRRWLAAGGKFEVWGWALKGARGKRKTWQVTEREIVLGDLP